MPCRRVRLRRIPPTSFNGFIDDGIDNGYNDGTAATGETTATFPFEQKYLTDVGAYTMAVSPYGTYDQSGNVWEWTEGTIDLRGHFGGGYDKDFAQGGGYFRFIGPEAESSIGFRIASRVIVPEPSSVPRLLLGLAVFNLSCRRRVRF